MKTIANILFFILIILSTKSYGQSISTVTGKIPIDLVTPRHTAKNKTTSRSGVYNAPPNCVILDYELNLKRKNGPGAGGTVNFVQGGSRFISTQEMNNAFSNSVDFATSLKIKGKDLADLKLKLDEKHNEYQKLQNIIEASHTTIEHKASMNAQGKFTGARSWYNADLNIKLLCVDDYLRSSADLKNNLREFVQSYSDSIPANAINTSPVEVDISNQSNQKFSLSPVIFIGILIFVSLVIIVVVPTRKRK